MSQENKIGNKIIGDVINSTVLSAHELKIILNLQKIDLSEIDDLENAIRNAQDPLQRIRSFANSNLIRNYISANHNIYEDLTQTISQLEKNALRYFFYYPRIRHLRKEVETNGHLKLVQEYELLPVTVRRIERFTENEGKFYESNSYNIHFMTVDGEIIELTLDRIASRNVYQEDIGIIFFRVYEIWEYDYNENKVISIPIRGGELTRGRLFEKYVRAVDIYNIVRDIDKVI